MAGGNAPSTQVTMHPHRRPATHADIPFLLALRRETMDRWFAAAGASLPEEAHLDRLMYCFECAEVLLQDGEPIGMLKVRRAPGAWDIIQMQIGVRCQGRGIGRVVLEELLAAAGAAHVEVRLGVLKANPARRLYERLGFVLTGEDADEYFMRWTAHDGAGVQG